MNSFGNRPGDEPRRPGECRIGSGRDDGAREGNNLAGSGAIPSVLDLWDKWRVLSPEQRREVLNMLHALKAVPR